MQTIKYINVEMSAVEKQGYTEVGQNDADGVELRVRLHNTGGTAYIPPEDAVITFNALKIDGHGVILSSDDETPKVTFTGNTVSVILSAQVLAVADIVLCKIIVTKDGQTASSQTFKLLCAEDLELGDLESSSVYLSLVALLNRLSEKEAEIDALKSGSPAGVFPTLADLQSDVDANTDDGKKRIYIVTADGHWYFWDDAWTDGGAYLIQQASQANVTDADEYFVNDNVEDVLQEVGADLEGLENDVTELDGDVANIQTILGTGILSGFEVTATDTMTVNVSAGTAILPSGEKVDVEAATIDASTLQSDTMDYHNLIYLNSLGTISYIQGTAVSAPATPEGGLAIEEVYVRNEATVIYPADITDIRDMAEDSTLSKQVADNTADIAQNIADVSQLKAETTANALSITETQKALSQLNLTNSPYLSVTGYDTLTLPKNTAQAPMQTEIKGMTLTNLITNGNFSDGTANWVSNVNNTLTTNNGELISIITTVDTSPYVRQDITTLSDTKKLYVRFKMMPFRTHTPRIRFSPNNYIAESITAGVYNDVSILVDVVPNTPQSFIVYDNNVSTEGMVIGSQTKYKDFMIIVINDTSMTKAECDAMYSAYFDGTQSSVIGREVSVSADGLIKSYRYNEPMILRRNADGVYDERDKNGNVIQRLDESGVVLAEPITHYNVSKGILNSYPNGTYYTDYAVDDVAVYSSGASIMRTGYPMSELESVYKYNADGTLTEIDKSTAVIAVDGLSFTHADLSNGDLTYFVYKYDVSTPKAYKELSPIDNTQCVLDSATDTWYKIGFAVNNGDISLTKTEV